MNKRLLLTLVSGLLVTFAAATVTAQECESDADCDEGYDCEMPSIACAEGPNGEGREDCEEERQQLTGECVRGPLSCDSDADCPGILTCQSWGSSSVPCTVDEEGNEECGDADPVEEELFCDWTPARCDDDTPCDEGFECEQGGEISVGEDCAEACDEEGNCTSDCGDQEPDFQETTEGYCIPVEIECETDDQCPTDWSCYSLSYEECSGSGSSGSGGTDDGDVPPEPGGGEQEGDEEACQTIEESRCIPPGFDQLIEQGGGRDFGGVAESGEGTFDGANRDDTGGAGEEQDEDSDGGSGSSDGGCSVPSGTPASAPLGIIALAGLLVLRVRR